MPPVRARASTAPASRGCALGHVLKNMLYRTCPVLLFGCVETAETRGRQVEVEADAGLGMCAGTLEHMDRFVERFAEEIGLPLTDEPWITFRWMTPEHYARRNPCGGMPACAVVRTVYASEMPHEHELIHSAASDLGLAHPFFVEGLAMAFEGGARDAEPTDDEPLPDAEVEPAPRVLAALRDRSTWLPGEYYFVAGAFTRYLIDRFGLRQHLEFYRRTWYADPYRALAREFRSVFGATLEDVVADFEAERADCHYSAWRFKLLECEAPEVTWDGDRLARHFTLDCDDAAAIGEAGVHVRTVHSFEVAAAGRFRVELRGDPAVRATFGSCGGCERAMLARLHVGEVQELELAAGQYFLRAETDAREPVTFGVVMERIGE
ncbi:hypothetical protein OV090_19145 [Nannocystis sp. RBIL2]|uniref:hypothetical protein n=2 Tax=unclassified Nannocystis TaxID=2627009 RepID=UPI0022714A1D|nr:hypothetical protein [Nannocystis sp. RBIL2]MCY1066896.1 hypothetical protein [Nannocystis sp. RBIL2]